MPSVSSQSFVIILVLTSVLCQCPKKDIKCTYPVLKEYIPSGHQLLGHASCIRKECSTVVEADNYISKNEVLRIHNELRQRIARGEDVYYNRQARDSIGAGNMLQLEWDDNLADNALKWAYQLCMDKGKPTGRLWRNDKLKCRSTDEFEFVGQNIFWEHDDYGLKNWKHAIMMWYDQRFNINDQMILIPPGRPSNVSDFLQLTWAHSFKVGCAFLKSTFDNPVDPAHRYYQSFYICNYGPEGNRPWLYAFRVGKAASNCPIGSYPSREYKGLCKVIDGYIVRQHNGNY